VITIDALADLLGCDGRSRSRRHIDDPRSDTIDGASTQVPFHLGASQITRLGVVVHGWNGGKVRPRSLEEGETSVFKADEWTGM
jgi:hypothetical protein